MEMGNSMTEHDRNLTNAVSQLMVDFGEESTHIQSEYNEFLDSYMSEARNRRIPYGFYLDANRKYLEFAFGILYQRLVEELIPHMEPGKKYRLGGAGYSVQRVPDNLTGKEHWALVRGDKLVLGGEAGLTQPVGGFVGAAYEHQFRLVQDRRRLRQEIRAPYTFDLGA